MKYFTRERLVRLQDHSDEQRFLAALDDWENSLKDYQQQLSTIKQHLRAIGHRIPALLKFLTMVSLHDARVLDMYSGGRSRFRITLHPEFQPGRLVILTYSLTQPPQIGRNVLPEHVRLEPITWLYDELTLEDRTGEEKPMFRHAILLSDGREVQLCFRHVAVERPIPVVPAVAAASGSQ
jgi:hypothetical protein